MTFWQKMFSFEGRLRRQDFWICTLILWGVSIVSFVACFSVAFAPLMALGMDAEKTGGQIDDAAALAAMMPFIPVILIFGLLQLAMIWPSTAIQVKRLHDRDQSGWMVLIIIFGRLLGWIPLLGVIPALGAFLFWLINLGILEGTPGPNRYGQSPKPEYGPAQAFA
jgi:uncharacterized membrane protein YhaH (DUF805 family)